MSDKQKKGIFYDAAQTVEAVSYTHLTLPPTREV